MHKPVNCSSCTYLTISEPRWWYFNPTPWLSIIDHGARPEAVEYRKVSCGCGYWNNIDVYDPKESLSSIRRRLKDKIDANYGLCKLGEKES